MKSVILKNGRTAGEQFQVYKRYSTKALFKLQANIGLSTIARAMIMVILFNRKAIAAGGDIILAIQSIRFYLVKA